MLRRSLFMHFIANFQGGSLVMAQAQYLHTIHHLQQTLLPQIARPASVPYESLVHRSHEALSRKTANTRQSLHHVDSAVGTQ